MLRRLVRSGQAISGHGDGPRRPRPCRMQTPRHSAVARRRQRWRRHPPSSRGSRVGHEGARTWRKPGPSLCNGGFDVGGYPPFRIIQFRRGDIVPANPLDVAAPGRRQDQPRAQIVSGANDGLVEHKCRARIWHAETALFSRHDIAAVDPAKCRRNETVVAIGNAFRRAIFPLHTAGLVEADQNEFRRTSGHSNLNRRLLPARGSFFVRRYSTAHSPISLCGSRIVERGGFMCRAIS